MLLLAMKKGTPVCMHIISFILTATWGRRSPVPTFTGVPSVVPPTRSPARMDCRGSTSGHGISLCGPLSTALSAS